MLELHNWCIIFLPFKWDIKYENIILIGAKITRNLFYSATSTGLIYFNFTIKVSPCCSVPTHSNWEHLGNTISLFIIYLYKKILKIEFFMENLENKEVQINKEVNYKEEQIKKLKSIK